MSQRVFTRKQHSFLIKIPLNTVEKPKLVADATTSDSRSNCFFRLLFDMHNVFKYEMMLLDGGNEKTSSRPL